MKIRIYKCQLVREAYTSYRYGHTKSSQEAKRIALEVTKELLENALFLCEQITFAESAVQCTLA